MRADRRGECGGGAAGRVVGLNRRDELVDPRIENGIHGAAEKLLDARVEQRGKLIRAVVEDVEEFVAARRDPVLGEARGTLDLAHDEVGQVNGGQAVVGNAEGNARLGVAEILQVVRRGQCDEVHIVRIKPDEVPRRVAPGERVVKVDDAQPHLLRAGVVAFGRLTSIVGEKIS